MIILLRSTDGEPDSRFEKYTTKLREQDVDHYTICWDRLGNKTPTDRKFYYKRPAGYGQKTGNILNLIRFNFYLLRNLLHLRKNYRTIHACDFDTLLPAIIMKFVFRKRVIYDIFDWYIDSRAITNPVIRFILLCFEFIGLHFSDVTIICEEERQEQLPFKPSRLWILPNIPMLPDLESVAMPQNKLTISYVGILGECRGLDKLLKCIQTHPEIHYKIAGFGQLDKEFENCRQFENVEFYGPVPYAKGLSIMNNSDIILALYEKTNKNHIYAAPNKYYEGLFLGKPIITTEGTLVGRKVAQYGTGFVIGERYEDLSKLLDNMSKEIIAASTEKSRWLWSTKYRTYISDFFNKTYLPFISQES